jgi:hypothetical protein
MHVIHLGIKGMIRLTPGHDRLMRGCCLTLGLSMSACFSGCGPRLPVYPALDSAATLATMAERSKAVQSIGARCRLILERPGDRSVELTAALVSRPPHQHRLRAWKITESVMDITITDEGVWMWARDNRDQPLEDNILTSFAPKTGATDSLREGLNIAFGSFDKTLWREAPQDGDHTQLVVDRPLNGEATMRCVIDRQSLTVTAVHIIDAESNTRFVLELDRYRRFGTAIIPTRFRGAAQENRFTLILQNVDLNGDLPADAFRPPRGATRQ